MRKKYLSALLFGALLVTSTGTFTSCKDYDDEINNLQEQIDKVVADLESLKTTVENLGGVTDVKIEGGKLLVTAGGKTVEYTIPTGEAGDVEKTVVELDGQDLKVDGKVIGQVGDKVTVNEDGYLCVNGKATEIKAGKYAVLDNDADGVVTITLPDANGELKTVELAKATSLVQLSNVWDNYFVSFDGDENSTMDINQDSKKETLYNIAWGSKAETVKWAGPKGNIAADQLLVGATPTAKVSILPTSFDLASQKLTFVNTMGKEAPVKITATAIENKPGTAGTRAITNAGAWELSMEMTSEVTKDNVNEIFTSNEKNVAYALAVNGTVISDYEFYVDTYAKATEAIEDLTGSNNSSALLLGINGLGDNVVSFIKGGDYDFKGTYPVKLGKTELTLSGSEAHKIYDAYIEVLDEDQAASLGVEVDGMTITSSNTAAQGTLRIAIHVIDVTGKEQKTGTYTISFGNTVAEDEEISAQTFTIVPDQEYVLVDLGNTFTSLTAAEAANINNNITWSVTNGNTLESITSDDVRYFASEAAANDDKNALDMANGKTILTARYAKMPLEIKSSEAQEGVNKVSILLKAGNNEIKKVTTDITIKLTSFDDLVTANSNALWNNDVFTTRMQKGTNLTALIPMNNAFVSKKNGTNNLVDVSGISYVYKDSKNNTVSGLDDIIKAKAVSNEFTATATISYGEGLKVEKTFTVNLLSIFEGAKLSYYVDGNASDEAIVGGNSLITPYSVDTNTPAKGLAIEFNKDIVPVKFTNDGDNLMLTVGGISITNKLSSAVSEADKPTAGDWVWFSANSSSSSKGQAEVTIDGIKINSLNEGEKGKLVLKFRDANGFETETSINYAK